MKVLFVNPILTMEANALSFPLNLLYLSTAAKNLPKVSVFALDLSLEYCRREFYGIDAIRAQESCINSFWQDHGSFDLVGISGLCDNYPLTIKLAEYVKNKFGPIVVIGGPHATFVAKESLRAFPFVDAVSRFDGVLAVPFLCRAVAGTIPFADVPNLVFRDKVKDCVVENSSGGIAGEGVIGVMPDYRLLSPSAYLKINPGMNMPILAGTGCPYQCSYCSSSLMWQRQYRARSPKAIRLEITHLKARYRIARYALVHDNLLFDRKAAIRLCSELSREGVRWGCSSRLNHIAGDQGLVRALSRAGCKKLFIGIETASARLQRRMKKRIDISQVIPIFRNLRGNGIQSVFSFIIGFPEESAADKDRTIRLAFRLKALGAERVNINNLSPLPGTVVAKNGLIFGKTRNTLGLQDVVPKTVAMNVLLKKHPDIFTSFAFARNKDGSSNTACGPAAAWLHDQCAKHPRAFDYLFRGTPFNPSDLISAWEEGFKPMALIRRRLSTSSYMVFREMMRYESEIRDLARQDISAAPASPLRINVAENWFQRKYVLTSRARIFKSPVHLSRCLQPSIRRKPCSRGRTFYCLFDPGQRIESYEIPEFVYRILIELKKSSDRPSRRPLADIAGRFAHGTNRSLMRAIMRNLVEIGILQHA